SFVNHPANTETYTFPYTTLFRSTMEQRPYSAADLSFLVALSQQAVVAIENARLFADAQDARQAAEQANEAKSSFLGVGEQPSVRSEEHTSELQSRFDLVCRLLLE